MEATSLTFAECYFSVFSPISGEIKVCGRDACKRLMAACEAQSKEHGPYGDPSTGYLNIANVQALAQEMGIISGKSGE